MQIAYWEYINLVTHSLKEAEEREKELLNQLFESI